MGYQIEDGVEIPPPVRGRKAKYPFGDLQVGQSFAVPLSEAKAARSTVGSFMQRNPGWKFRVRKTEKNFRIWRVE